MFATAILTIVIVILLLALLVPRWRASNYPPGPFSWPFIGNQSLLRRLTSELGAQHLAFLELSKRYGSNVISLRLGTTKTLIASGNKAIQTILNNEEFDGRPWNEFIKLRNMGKKNGITMNDGAEWKDLRGWMIRTLKTVGFGRREMSEMIKDELLVILDNLKEGGVVRIKPLLAPSVINVLWTVATGKRLCEGPRLQYFIDLMERRSRAFDMVGGVLSAFPWIRYVAPETSGYNLIFTLNNELKGFLMEAITEHKKKYVPGSEADLIDMFLREMFEAEEAGSVFTEEQLVMILIDLFLAGCTTTTTSLDFLFLNMLVHQDVQRKVQEEIDSVIPPGRLPDVDDRAKLPYTEAVLSESLRMWPVFPVIGPRRVLRDTTVENYRIPKDSSILLNIYSVNMDPNLFDDPHTFKPDRFLKNGVYETDENVIVFGKGRRRCPGVILARSALFLLFVGIMQKYNFLPVPGKGPSVVQFVPGLTISPKPYELLVVPRRLCHV